MQGETTEREKNREQESEKIRKKIDRARVWESKMERDQNSKTVRKRELGFQTCFLFSSTLLFIRLNGQTSSLF